MSQASIDEYFTQKKRKITQDHGSNKVLLLNSPIEADLKCPSSPGQNCTTRRRAVLKLNFDIGSSSSTSSTPELQSKKNVKFVKRGDLSPEKRGPPKVGNIQAYFTKKNNEQAVEAPKPGSGKPSKQLSLDELGKRLCRGGRLAELKASIDRLNEGFSQLDKVKSSQSSSSLKEFKQIEVLVPQSPSKSSPVKKPSSPMTSPMKNVLMSPRKPGESPLKSPAKVPAYQRFAHLDTPIPELSLPHHYKWLAEVFRGIETASSMLHNRREIITFSKVKLAVQEMLKRNLSEKHLAQIKHLCPKMYSFSREKIKNFGTTAKRDEFELVLTPNLVNQTTGSPITTMTPNVVLERRRSFHNLLLDKVVDHHSAYLLSLDPPVNIPRAKLQRWHPEFDIEHIPDVDMEALPEAPNVERYSTAQDVLGHLKEKFNCNTRMERALQKLTEAKARGLTLEEQKVTGLDANGDISHNSTQTENQSSSSSEFPLNPALKGIPKSLLEKIRAKQAAKALQSMTRCPVQERNALTYQRLPDLAKLLRNLFVTEKKSILPLELIVSKLDNSSRSKISSADLTSHLRTLASEISDWLTFYDVRKVEYIKMKKDADMTKILHKLDELAKKHSVN